MTEHKRDQEELSEGILDADDTGMVRNEAEIVEEEIEEGVSGGEVSPEELPEGGSGKR